MSHSEILYVVLYCSCSMMITSDLDLDFSGQKVVPNIKKIAGCYSCTLRVQRKLN